MLFSAILTVMGLTLFESVSSVDNAIINAEVLSTMGAKSRKWFLTWGMFFSVFLVRGILPLLIIWAFNTSLTPFQVISAAWSSDPKIGQYIAQSAPVLLVAGGVFLIFLFLHWLFLEDKRLGLRKTEKFFLSHGVWFYAFVSVILAVISWFSLRQSPLMGFGAIVGSSLFFITHGFKQNAEEQERKLMSSAQSDFSKILFLEIIDSTFSIDGVLGSFAFTFSVLLIFIGTGLGAILVRELTIRNIENIKKYVYLKHGAMYSIFGLGMIMILQSFGYHIPEYVSPVMTFGIIIFFFLKSKAVLKATYNE
jgi:hypothetical protein